MVIAAGEYDRIVEFRDEIWKLGRNGARNDPGNLDLVTYEYGEDDRIREWNVERWVSAHNRRGSARSVLASQFRVRVRVRQLQPIHAGETVDESHFQLAIPPGVRVDDSLCVDEHVLPKNLFGWLRLHHFLFLFALLGLLTSVYLVARREVQRNGAI